MILPQLPDAGLVPRGPEDFVCYNSNMDMLCHRCGRDLTPGAGDFYVVRIDAVCDPSPPVFTAEEIAAASADSIRKLLDDMRESSGQELMDQVHRNLTLHLCRACYNEWIENPCR